jgi:hypothetical protein
VSNSESTWDPKILAEMKAGAVTFAWDDGEIQTVSTPEGALKNLKAAWEWIDAQMREFTKGKGRPRSICLRLENGEFRGLKFPDVKPGMIDDPL